MQEQHQHQSHLQLEQTIQKNPLQQQKIKQQKIQHPAITIKVRNRRFKKLQQLRNQGFFTEEAIKLRHPLFYHLFVGQYDFVQQQAEGQFQGNTLSAFLEKHLLNIQYKELLNFQMSQEVETIIKKENQINEQQIRQLKRIFKKSQISKANQHKDQIFPIQQNWKTEMDMEIEIKQEYSQKLLRRDAQLRNYEPSSQQIQTLRNTVYRSSQSFKNSNGSSYSRPKLPQLLCTVQDSTQRLSSQQKCLQEQSLIEYCEELFLEGKLHHCADFNYAQIDQNSDYDDQKENDLDSEEKFFNQVEDSVEEGIENYYTGVLDY